MAATERGDPTGGGDQQVDDGDMKREREKKLGRSGGRGRGRIKIPW